MRDALRSLRKVVLNQVPGMDVTALTDDEALAEAAAVIPLADVATAPTAVQRAVNRVDTAVPTDDPDPATRALRAAIEASEYADIATGLEAEATG